MINVLHLIAEKTWRGGEQQVAYLIEESEKLGMRPYVFCEKNSEMKTYCEKKGIHHFALGYMSMFNLAGIWLLDQYCSRNHIHVIHLHSSKAHGFGVLAAWLGLRIPLVLSRRVLNGTKKNQLGLWKYNHRSIKSVICVSDAVKKTMSSAIKDTQKVLTIYSGVNTQPPIRRNNDLKEQLKIPDSHSLIGTIGALTAEKDPLTFLLTAKKMLEKRSSLSFLVVGDGKLRGSLTHFVQKYSLQNHVHFMGYLNHEEVINALNHFDLLLMTSTKEGLGTSILDAFVVGCPVVATRVGGMPELIEHQETGLLANPQNAQELCDACLRLLNETPLRKKLVKNASQKVMMFSKEEMAMKTRNVYAEVVGRIKDWNKAS